MGDEEVGERELLLQPLQERDDLGLDRDVEGGDWFIADEEARGKSERSSNSDALPLAAAKFVGKTVFSACR